MARSDLGSFWFFGLMSRELELAETKEEETAEAEDAEAEESVETLLSKLLDEAGSIFQTYVEDDLDGSDMRTERACARVANRALAVALLVREERS